MFFLPALLGAAGKAVGIFGQLGAADQREEIAAMNFQIESQNATVQRQQTNQSLSFKALGNSLQHRTTQLNAQLALGDADMMDRNANRMREFAELKTKEGREAVRRRRRQFEAFQSTQQSVIGSSGVDMSGSALDVLVDTAGQMAIAIEDMHDSIAFERAETLDKATMTQFQAGQQRIGAQAEQQFGRVANKLNRGAIRLGRISADLQYNSAMMSAEMNLLNQQSAAAGQRTSAFGSALSGAGSFIQSVL